MLVRNSERIQLTISLFHVVTRGTELVNRQKCGVYDDFTHKVPGTLVGMAKRLDLAGTVGECCAMASPAWQLLVYARFQNTSLHQVSARLVTPLSWHFRTPRVSVPETGRGSCQFLKACTQISRIWYTVPSTIFYWSKPTALCFPSSYYTVTCF